MEVRSQVAASRALVPAYVHVENNDNITDIDLKDLRNGDITLIKPGEKIPAGGLVVGGSSYVNESLLTGESVPVKKEKEQKVIGGSINGDGSLRVKITGTAKDGYLNKVITMLQTAQSAKIQHTQNLADNVAKWLTIVSITIGAATFIYWFAVEKKLAFAQERMVAVLITMSGAFCQQQYTANKIPPCPF